VESEKHKKTIEYNQACDAVYDNLYIRDSNEKNIISLSELNNNDFKNYNNWYGKNFYNENIKILEIVNSIGHDAGKKLMSNLLTPHDDKIIPCPWCSEYNVMTNCETEDLTMPLDECIEHMKICMHKKNHVNIEKNITITLFQTLEIISAMLNNFSILSTSYDSLKHKCEGLVKTNDELLKNNDNLMKINNDSMIKLNKLKTKYNTLKEINRIKCDELFKASILKTNEKKVNLTINGNGNCVNLLAYIGDNCKDAQPINAPIITEKLP
jgi:hypothetical protein